MDITIGFMLALFTFYVNQRIHKMINIKITINSLFDIYGNETCFDHFEPSEVAKRLMDEIIIIEKLNDNNFYINLELDKLKALRLAYFKFPTYEPERFMNNQIKSIKFKPLDRSFIFLSYLNVELPYYREYINKKNK